MMTLNEYQEKAMTTCMETCNNFSYMFLNLVGEVGEFASKVAKNIRHGDSAIIAYNNLLTCNREFVNTNDILMKEAGDILWQLSGLCMVMGWTLEDVAQMNLDKLASRQQRGVIDGSGDNR